MDYSLQNRFSLPCSCFRNIAENRYGTFELKVYFEHTDFRVEYVYCIFFIIKKTFNEEYCNFDLGLLKCLVRHLLFLIPCCSDIESCCYLDFKIDL